MAGTIETVADSLGYDVNYQSGGATLVTPNDGADLAVVAKGLYVGGAGNIKVTMANDDVVLFSGVPAGTFMPIVVKRVWSTTTTATLIIALK